MGGAKNGAVAPAAGNRRVVGTIAEAAAIARAAARHEPAPEAVPAGEITRRHPGRHRDSDPHRANSAAPGNPDDVASRADAEADAPRRACAAPVEETPEDDADKTAAHLIAGRAYAYGRSIVEADPDAKKTGETVAIES